MKPEDEISKESMDRLLNIIVTGDPEIILSEDNTEGFKELMKYELITFNDGKVCLTELGVEAQKVGVCSVIEKLRLQPAIPIASSIKLKTNRKMLIPGLVSLSLLLLLLWGYLMVV